MRARHLIRLAGLLVIVVMTVGLTVWALSTPNDVYFSLPGLEGETSRAKIALVMAILGGVIAFIWWLLAWVFGLPGRLTKGVRQSKVNKARNALADGLIAAEGGDGAHAAKQAKRAAALTKIGTPDRKLALLLAARAAEANDDWIEAERAYGELSREKGAELAGLRGLAAAAVKRGDQHGAQAHARSAFLLKSKADWPFGSLFELQTKAADWMGAIETLIEGEKRGAIDTDAAKRRRAVLLTAEAMHQRRNDPALAERMATDAHKLSPGFPPAAWLLGRLQLAGGRAGKAVGTIENAWKARPHPALALLWSDLRPGENPAAHAKRIEQLAATNESHRESRILVGEAAIATGDWLKAAETLAPLLDEGATGRLCSLMEAVSKGRREQDDAARWGRLAATAAREPDWSDIDPDGQAFDYSDADWARMIYTYGDGETLIHPRYEGYGRELETLSRLALPAPNGEDKTDSRDTPDARPISPPAPDYVPKD